MCFWSRFGSRLQASGRSGGVNSWGTEVLPELQAVSRLYNRLRELREEHENNHDLSRREEVHHAYHTVRGRQLGSAVFHFGSGERARDPCPKASWMDPKGGNHSRSRLTRRRSLTGGQLDHGGSGFRRGMVSAKALGGPFSAKRGDPKRTQLCP